MTDPGSPPSGPAVLEESQAFLEAIIENIPNMIFVKDAQELRFVRFNKAGEELLGIPRGQIYGKNDHDLFPEEQADFFADKDRAVLDSGSLHDIPEEPIQTVGKGQRWLHTKKIPIPGPDGRPLYLLGISEDITERRAHSEERERLVLELSRSNKDLEEFAYAASHDLQAPLRKVQAFGDLLQDRHGEALGEQGRRYLERMCSSAARMELLIRDLLEFSRVATQPQSFSPVRLNDVVADVVSDLSAGIQQSDAKVEVDELLTVEGDRAQLERLILNLLGNALKFAKPGTPPRVWISADLRDDATDAGTSGPVAAVCELTIRDDGIGLDDAHAERIFGVFERLHSQQEYPGTGIGLALCRKIVQRHQGSIEVESSEGHGATFRVRLPVPMPPAGAP